MCSHLYRVVAPMEFIPDGWEMTLVRPCERAFVRVGPSNRYKCSYLYPGQKDPAQIIKKQVGDICVIL
jgi:hypothetical protein